MALEPQQKKSSVKTTEYILPDCCCCFNEDQHRVQLSDPSVHTPCTPKAEHTGCTLGHSTFQKRPRSHARHTPSRPHDTTSPHWATNICQPGRRVTAGEETPYSTPTSPRSTQARDSHALRFFFNALNFPHGLHKRYPQCWVPYPSETKGWRTHSQHKSVSHTGTLEWHQPKP